MTCETYANTKGRNCTNENEPVEKHKVGTTARRGLGVAQRRCGRRDTRFQISSVGVDLYVYGGQWLSWCRVGVTCGVVTTSYDTEGVLREGKGWGR